jgi:phosphoenolpyruvate carboxykinase (GTP)
MASETTAAAVGAVGVVRRDSMAMKPFCGYNFADYWAHWLSFEGRVQKLPKIFHVNWFRLGTDGKFLWPGYGDNVRVIDWICRRVAGEESAAVPSPVGLLPAEGSMNLDGLGKVDWNQLFSLPKAYWSEDIAETKKFLDEQVGCDLPEAIVRQLAEQEARIAAM